MTRVWHASLLAGGESGLVDGLELLVLGVELLLADQRLLEELE
jgi:hypothetical protein